MDMELQWRLWDLESREPISPFIQLPIVANECRFAPDERSLIAYNSVKQFVRLPFRIDPRPWRDLERHAWLLSGGWEAEGNEATNMDREKVHNTYRELRLKYPEYFRVSAEEILRWHLAEAHHSERLQRWAGASHHLELLSRMKPEDGGITARLTRARELAARAPAPSP
jgi:hypothetical protein